jgi:hypothetical protein
MVTDRCKCRDPTGHGGTAKLRSGDYGAADPPGAASVAAGGFTVLLFVLVVVDGEAPGPRAKYQTAARRTMMPMTARMAPMLEPPPLSTTTVS